MSERFTKPEKHFHRLSSNVVQCEAGGDDLLHTNDRLVCDPLIFPTNSCRNTWTPWPLEMFKSVINDWDGTFGFTDIPVCPGRGCEKTWDVGRTVFNSLRFLDPWESYGPIWRSTEFESGTLDEPETMFWTMEALPTCANRVLASIPPIENTITVESPLPIPPPLSDADFVAMGFPNSYPGLLDESLVLGPIMKFSCQEVLSAITRFVWVNGEHGVSSSFIWEMFGRTNMYQASCSVSGVYPHRVGTFSLHSMVPDDDTRTIVTFSQGFGSTVKTPTYYQTTPHPFVESLTPGTPIWSTNAVNLATRLSPYPEPAQIPGDPTTVTVVTPTASSITWGRA